MLKKITKKDYWRVVGWRNHYVNNCENHHLIAPDRYHEDYHMNILFYSGSKKWKREFSLGTKDISLARKYRDNIYKALLYREFTEEQLTRGGIK